MPMTHGHVAPQPKTPPPAGLKTHRRGTPTDALKLYASGIGELAGLATVGVCVFRDTGCVIGGCVFTHGPPIWYSYELKNSLVSRP